MNETLAHYGILGMKWGIRRTPEQLGHVKKGTKMYRTTPNPNEEEKGSTYVTRLEVDRDLYRGAWANNIRENYSLKPDDPLYESVYEAKKDLKVATDAAVQKALTDVLKEDDGKIMKDVAKDIVKDQTDAINRMKKFYKEYSERTGFPSPSDKQIEEEYYSENGKRTTESVLKDLGSYNSDYVLRVVSARFGRATLAKEATIVKLKNEGYHAMIDLASVGGKTRKIEGVAPMIIFDRNAVMDKIGSNEISKSTQKQAFDNYLDWYRKVNGSMSRINNWS